ncbi:MAG: hypothetical protein IJ861_10295 [Clostridia bacterium]|nr:hypothetical protein [Clostridia bacterium]
MKIAVAFDKETENITENLSDTIYFMIYEFDGNVFTNVELVSTMEKSEFELAEILSMMEVDLLICGNMEPVTEQSFDDEGIQVFSSIYGSSDEAVFSYMTGRELKYRNSDPV